MSRKLLIPLFAVAVLATAIAADIRRVTTPSASAAVSTTRISTSSTATEASSTSLTASATAAANAFLATLSSSQKAQVVYAFNSSKKQSGWSNLPTGLVPRNGIAIKAMSAAQVAKLRVLLKTVLSPAGYADEEAVRKADTYLAQQQANGNGGAQQLQYGEGLYYISFFGAPSTSSKWMLQFGGHHLAINLTFSGNQVSGTPYFMGVEPSYPVTVGGKTYAPLANEVADLFGAVKALNASQLAKAKLSQSFDDVLVGAQKDGQFPTAQGITVSTLSKAQQALVTKAIWSYLGDMSTTTAKAKLKLYVGQYAQTKLSWSKSTNSKTVGAYVRIQGPRLWLELAVQNGIVLSGPHYHSIMRDIKSDYGAGT